MAEECVHNVLLHLNYLAPVTVKYADNFPIVNLQSSPELMMDYMTANTARDGIYMPTFYFPESIRYAVVHQYDRDSIFQLKLGKKYLPSINWDSPLVDWAETKECTANFGVIFGIDFLQGQCDSGSVRGMTPSSCCNACLNLRKEVVQHSPSNQVTPKACTAFSYSQGICYLKNCPSQQVQRTALIFERNMAKSLQSSKDKNNV